MKGLIVKAPWIDLLLEGKKSWEIRGRQTNIRGEIALIQSGTGHIYGTINIVDCKELTWEEYQQSESFHCIPKELRITPPYKRIYAWVLENPIQLERPIPYHHPQGAVIWVNLNEEFYAPKLLSFERE